MTTLIGPRPHSTTPRPLPISVNGVAISRAAIAREAQHHPAPSAAASLGAAAEALIVRELLLQEARARRVPAEPRTLAGQRETADEASIRAIVESAVRVPEPTEAELQRYYETNRRRFRSPELFEVRHILVAARATDAEAYAAAQREAEAIADELASDPQAFDRLARDNSDCSSAAEGGWLGQLTPFETTPEFAAAVSSLAEGETTRRPVATRYGFHIIHLERRIAGKQLPCEAVAPRIRDYLVERARRTATAQYIARLVSAANIVGIDLASAEAHRVSPAAGHAA